MYYQREDLEHIAKHLTLSDLILISIASISFIYYLHI